MRLLAAALALWGGMAAAHGTEVHSDTSGAPEGRVAAADLPKAVTPLPWDLGGPFALVDHTGAARTEAEPQGRMQLLFFGYATCPGICSAALPLMAEMAEGLSERGVEVVPVMVTIDPKLDTVDTMGPALAEYSPRIVGLTGTEEALQVAYDAYRVEFEHLFDDPEHGPIYSHGAHIYLLSGAGEVLTLLPPVLPAEQAVAIVSRYAGEG
ncbi:SCO family protein [Pseudaestuariivita atlantica]|uniref:Photosynthetic protein synthase I n=1 Tax=Pseudaestuariivita atlantica TaxID=1317121 RepID=A0A0L1JM01_9RHOB|nr:SCO family protein [Pseudaestuariivita atlantica]KNG92780.1 photosynthetic protein synthase I [Pseudaestuariivita atlantica]